MTAATRAALARHLHLLLDHRGDDEHVVGRQVLRARVLHVDLAPRPLERLELVVDELRGGRVLGEVVRGREEKPLEVRRVRSLEARRQVRRLLRGRQVRLGRRDGEIPRSSSAILLTAAMRAAICFRVNPSGKMILRTGFGGAVSRAVVSTSDEPPAPDAEADHGPPDRREQAEAEHDAEQRRQPTTALPAVVVPYAGRLLAFHCR